MFRTLLIANRGEVAVRIARTARALGIRTVGVASKADLGAGWLSALDEVVPIGGSSPRESYLRAETLVQAGLQTRCSAVHPGWGFLAESAEFAALCAQHGLAFVGPPPEVMERTGLKWPAKAAVGEAGLEGIPGSDGLLEDARHARREAARVGYPVILKADAGGGGRGMRRAANEAELEAAFVAATAEAEAAFGSGRLYLERYVEGGRHVEVQILADRFGSALHLGERDCSVQRKHQKLLEESPSPALAPEERESLGHRAARAAAAIGYVGAGTMEFLRAADGSLWFMEINSRLQVEHPVTEMVTGIDIVAEQLRIAASHALSMRQDDVRPSGHAIECRINAEDPERDFRPAPGKLDVFELATDEGPGRVRVDTHLAAGEEVTPFYDSLVAKVIAHGATRDEAIATMERALAASRIEGVETTLPLHRAVLASEAFRSGRYDTRAVPGWGVAQEVR